MKTVYKLWVEWEIGQDDVVFSSKKKAYEWLEDRLPALEIDETVGELFEEGNAGIDEIEVI